MLEGKFWNALANVVLIGSSVWALNEFRFPKISLTNWAMFLHLILGTTGILNLLLVDSRLSGDALDIVKTFAYPCVATQMFLINGFHELAFIPLGGAAIIYAKDMYHGRPSERLSQDPLRVIMLGTTVALVLWGVVVGHLFIICMALWFALCFFWIGTTGKVLSMPATDVFLYGLAVFNVLTVLAFQPCPI